MKTNIVRSSLLLLLLFTGCEKGTTIDGYKDIGKFSTKTDGRGAALKRVVDRFDKLPEKKAYKVLYSFDPLPNERGKESLWYDKTNKRLTIEQDIGSGGSCSWEEVDKTVLQAVMAIGKGITGIDSLSQGRGDTSRCL
jgi:hypothetical protein